LESKTRRREVITKLMRFTGYSLTRIYVKNYSGDLVDSKVIG